ncbi:MAG: 4Fe-4S binding protein [Thermofilaceae archaeon]
MVILKDMLWNLFKKRATIMYPEERSDPPDSFRGKLGFNRNECIGCGLCRRVCPASAIEMEDNGKGVRPIFHIERCIYCYLCIEVCPTKAIKPRKEYAVVAFKKSDLVVK